MIETTLNVVLDLCLAGSELTVTVSDYAGHLIVVFIDIYYIKSDYAENLIVVWAVCAFFHRRKLLVVANLQMNIF